MTLDFSKHFVSKHFTLEDAMKSDKPIRYVMGSDGIYKVVSNSIGVFCVKVDEVPGAENISETFKLGLPKIPYNMFLQTLSFFRDVCAKKGEAEAMVQFYYDSKNIEYIVHCPKQTVTKGSVKYERNTELDNKYILVLDIHSHNTMGAKFSSIDDGDEKENMLFGVIGKVDKATPDYTFRAGVGGVFKTIDIFDIFENPFQAVSYPDEWLSIPKKPESKKQASTSRSRVGETYRDIVAGSRDSILDDYYTGSFERYQPSKHYEYFSDIGEAVSVPVIAMDEGDIIDLMEEFQHCGLFETVVDVVNLMKKKRGV